MRFKASLGNNLNKFTLILSKAFVLPEKTIPHGAFHSTLLCDQLVEYGAVMYKVVSFYIRCTIYFKLSLTTQSMRL